MTIVNDSATWFLAQLKPKSHRIAERNLRRQGFTTFLPMQDRTRTRHGKFSTTPEPLFPGYIFVAFDTAQGGWRSVNATSGVTRLVSVGGAPVAVPQDLVSQLMQRCDAEGKLRTAADLAPGDRARFSSGPFAGFVTEIEAVAPDRRVWVLLEFMGRTTRVAADPVNLHPA
ncbi:transcription termination/antitermination protein NusG [Pontibaca salina]|uniref:Transcriptional activator RfaH n=1 Tax=Pontibaca salina TaxID=2795731 RepID=A0A934M0Y8_9RHOB|nr:transcriptional activator RfaH [Pontibaca salina]MBI6630490.1 transcriptional activator RfaH [Pontibaca salina]